MGLEEGNISASAMSPLYLPEIVAAGTESHPPRSTGNVAVTATQLSGRLLSVAKELLFVFQ